MHSEEYLLICQELHDKAQEEKSDHYIDPATGAYVFTSEYHRERGECCGAKCRHCPYNHVNVPPSRKN